MRFYHTPVVPIDQIEVIVSTEPDLLTYLVAGTGVISVFVLMVSVIFLAIQAKAARVQSMHLGVGDRLLAAHQFILTIETDKESLEAKSLFGQIRDQYKEAGASNCLKTIFDVANQKREDLKDAAAIKEYEAADEDYRKLLRHLNTLEMMAVGIRSGCFDERLVKLYKMNGVIGEVSIAQEAIEVVRKQVPNEELYTECLWLAWRWKEMEGDTRYTLTLDRDRYQGKALYQQVGWDAQFETKRKGLRERIARKIYTAPEGLPNS